MSGAASTLQVESSFLRGHANAFFADKLGFLTRCARDGGDVVRLRFGPYRFLLLSNPKHIGEVLMTRAEHFHKSVGLKRTRILLGDGLLTSEGQDHNRRSRIAQPAFRKQEILRYTDDMAELTELIVGGWRDGERIDLSVEFSRLALAIVARTLFGANLLDDASQIGAALTEVLELMEERLMRMFPTPLFIPTRDNRRFRRARAVLDEAVFKMIRERRAGTGRPDLLSRLLEAPEQTGGLSDRELRDEVMTLFLAGHETTANALTFTFWLLARHPETLKAVRDEAQEVVGERPVRSADIGRLALTNQVFSEAMSTLR